ncbi:MAG: replication factor C small subunit [Euryarchaeota archaeon]|nr:replication factor C small subunit [Euryarchaeota archaeon]
MVESIWVEKYRPEKVGEIVGQKDVVERLKGYIQARNLPNMLFAGPPGTGKTTSAVVVAKELFGSDWQSNFLELNASDERGIDIVRGKIKDFARTRSLGGEFKIVFLDEADALTKDAQHALRRTMEKYSGTCRFILSCNYSSKIIEPIQSRCALFRFRPLAEDEIADRLGYIAEKEGVRLSRDGLQAILDISEGDLRKAINILQSSCAFDREITEDLIYKVVPRAQPEVIRDIIKTARSGDFLSARKKLRDTVISQGLSGEDVIRQIHREVFRMEEIPDRERVRLVDRIGEYEFRIMEGSNELIQLEALLAQFMI